MRRPGRPRDARADRAILQAALDLTAEVGLAELTVDAVAARAGVSKATLYRRWASKEAMLLDALGALDPMEATALPDTGSLKGDLIQAGVQASELYAKHQIATCLPDVLAAARVSPDLRPLAERLMQQKGAPLDELFARAVARGEIAADLDVNLVRAALFGPILYLMFSGQTVGPETFAAVAELLLTGIARQPVAPAAPAAPAAPGSPDSPDSPASGPVPPPLGPPATA